jgi:hypothetical protein
MLRLQRLRRRSRRWLALATVVIALAAVAVAVALSLWIGQLAGQLPADCWRRPARGLEGYLPAPEYRGARSVFPYSVVPGGVISEEEVEASVASDPVVAQHYAGIITARLQLTRLPATIYAYASFRTANGVHWTTRKIRVPKGELLLSDGVNLIRARCGNRLNFAPPEGALPPAPPPPIEPPEVVLEHGLPPILRASPVPLLQPFDRPRPEPTTPYWPPVATPVVWCCVLGVPAGPGLPPTSPSTGVPEPRFLVLVGSGMLVVKWFARKYC